MKKQIVYLDMDGTIANLYGIENWLDGLLNEVEGLFLNCEPLVSSEELEKYFPNEKYELRICSMTPLNASEEYCKVVIEEKNLWLDKYFPQITHRVYMKYGSNKNLKNCQNHILVDDNEKIRNTFKGLALAPLWL